MSKQRAVWATAVIALLWLTIAATWLLQPPRDDLLGTWVVDYSEVLGQKLPADQTGRMKIEFHADKAVWHFRQGDGWRSWNGTLWRDPKSNPKQIDISQPNNPNTVGHGIYKIEGDTLTITMGAIRPKTFEEPSVAKLVFRRQ